MVLLVASPKLRSRHSRESRFSSKYSYPVDQRVLMNIDFTSEIHVSRCSREAHRDGEDGGTPCTLEGQHCNNAPVFFLWTLWCSSSVMPYAATQYMAFGIYSGWLADDQYSVLTPGQRFISGSASGISNQFFFGCFRGDSDVDRLSLRLPEDKDVHPSGRLHLQAHRTSNHEDLHYRGNFSLLRLYWLGHPGIL